MSYIRICCKNYDIINCSTFDQLALVLAVVSYFWLDWKGVYF